MLLLCKVLPEYVLVLFDCLWILICTDVSLNLYLIEMHFDTREISHHFPLHKTDDFLMQGDVFAGKLLLGPFVLFLFCIKQPP